MERRSFANVCVLIFVSYFASSCPFIPSHASTTANVREITFPVPTQAFSPRVTATRDGSVLLTWLEAMDGRLSALRSAFLRNGPGLLE